MTAVSSNENHDKTKNNKAIVVVLLMGLPASGKSSLAKWLVEACCQQSAAEGVVEACHIEYDRVEESLLLLERHSNSNCIKNEDDAFSPDVWKHSRSKSLQYLKEQLRKQQQHSTKSAKRRLILMDDNFHLRSMRREVYRICQEIVSETNECKSTNTSESDDPPTTTPSIYFVILWLNVPAQQCLERNQKRQRNGIRSVPDNVIQRMSNTLEPPGKETWEQCFLKLDNDLPLWEQDNNTKQDNTLLLEDIQDFLLTACMEKYSPVPPPPPPIDLEQLEAERRKTRESWLHSWDQRFRSWVGKVAQISRSDTPKANKARKILLQTLRQQQQQQHTDGDELLAVPSNAQIIDWFLKEMNWLGKQQADQFYTAIQDETYA